MQLQPSLPSTAVRAAHRIVTAGLWIAAALGVFVAASIAVGVARHGNSLLYGDSLSIPVQVSPPRVKSLPDGLSLVDPVDAIYKLRDPSVKETLARSLQDVGPVVLMLALLWQLRGFTRSVVAGDPFGSDNVRRLRRLGFLVLLGVPLVDILNAPLRAVASDPVPSAPGLNVSVHGFTLSLNTALVALAVFVLAEVFAYGSSLREDVEATV